jgi:hypothetical protein
MYAILVKKYMSPLVVDFIHTLSKTVRLRMDHSTSLRAALIHMDSIMHTWESTQYWKYKNPDIFFTMVYLYSLPASLQDARDKAMYYVLQRLQETDVLSTRQNPVDKIVLKLSGQDTTVVPTIAALYPLLRI